MPSKLKRSYRHGRQALALLTATALVTANIGVTPSYAAGSNGKIKHVVVIFGENESFDHYFGTYPDVENPAGSPHFKAAPDTPTANTLATAGLLQNNPNLKAPYRMDRTEAFSCDMDHDYTDEQKAVNGGLMDKFVQATSSIGLGCRADGSTVMGYFDGNTVTALWNYAQNYAMSDNAYGSMFGPSTVGALNLVSGQTGFAAVAMTFARGEIATHGPTSTVTGDPDPAIDDCGADAGGTKAGAGTVEIQTGRNIGDLLNARGVTWGWFQGGFTPTQPATLNADGSTKTPAVCGSAHVEHQFTPPGRSTPTLVVANPSAQDGQTTPPTDIHVPTADYVPHHEAFQYYQSTRNPHHLRPVPDRPKQIGKTDQANHQYDMNDFFDALQAGNLPAVSFLKAPKYQNAHPGNSDPLTEQTFIVSVVNALQQSPFWDQTAVIINYDDSDGWYDHQMGPIVNHSANQGNDNGSLNASDSLIPTLPLSTSTAAAAPDAISSSGVCGIAPAGAPPGAGRCGYGPRLPYLVISPWARQNFIDHTVLDQTSTIRFIEDNWNLGFIDGATLPAGSPLGSFSFDQVAGKIDDMFDFKGNPNLTPVILNEVTGVVQK